MLFFYDQLLLFQKATLSDINNGIYFKYRECFNVQHRDASTKNDK